jgi:DNA polymerase III alpha subunit (gram-positive type)
MGLLMLSDYSVVIYFDAETTGLNPLDGDEITQFGAILQFNDNSIVEFDELLFTDKKIPSEVIQLTGITNELIQSNGVNPELFSNFLYSLNTVSDKMLFVIHNAQFDLTFINELMKKYNLELQYSKIDVIDTLTIAKDRFGYPHKLQNCVKYYGLNNECNNNHTAIEDVRALKMVFECMLDKGDVLSYINLFGYPKKYGIQYTPLDSITYREQKYNSDLPLYECED